MQVKRRRGRCLQRLYGWSVPLFVAFGENRDRFPTASSLQKSAGIAPVMERSGNKAWVHWRRACNKFVRQTFVEWAAQTIQRLVGRRHVHATGYARSFRTACEMKLSRACSGETPENPT